MIEIDNLTVTFKSGGYVIPALSSLSLKVDLGEYLTVLGANGSGKSTLVKALCGAIPIQDGKIRVGDTIVSFGRFGEDLFGTVGVVFQEPSGQFLMPSVRMEIDMVLQNLGLPDEARKERFDRIVEQFYLTEMLGKSPDDLSGGQMQIVNLCCALVVSPEILLLDEPTTFLDGHCRELLLDYLDGLHDGGLTILHVTQYPDEALRSNRTCILDRGQIAAAGEPWELLFDEDLLGRCNLAIPRRLACKRSFNFDYNDSAAMRSFCSNINVSSGSSSNDYDASSQCGDIILSVKNISFEYPDSSFRIGINRLDLYGDQIVGLVGPAGSGKSTLAFLLAGLLSPSEGSIALLDRPVAEFPVRELRRLIGIGWQMPEPLLTGPTVFDDIKFSLDNLGIDDGVIGSILSEIGLGGFEDRIVDSLSGGEKRKISLAGILGANPAYLILDEPAAFLDPVSQLDLIRIIGRIAASGIGILLLGHELPFISELADRIIGMKNGGIMFDLSSSEFFSNPACLEQLDLPPDPIIEFRHCLSKDGVVLPHSSLDPVRIATRLKEQEII